MTSTEPINEPAVDINAVAIAEIQKLDAKMTKNRFDFVDAELLRVYKTGFENNEIAVQNIDVEYNSEKRKIILKGGDLVLEVVNSYNKDSNTIKVPWGPESKNYRLSSDKSGYWATVKSTKDIDAKAYKEANNFYKDVASRSFTFVTATLLDKHRIGGEEKGLLTQTFVVEYNGERREVTVEGAQLILAVARTADVENRTISIPWSSKIPSQYTKSPLGKYWAKL